MTLPRPRVRARTAWTGAAVLVALQLAVLAAWPGAHALMIDLQVYRAGGEHVLHHQPLYAGGVLLDLPFVYPPVAAVLFVPLTLLPLPLLKIFWTALGVVLLVLVVRRSAALVGTVLPAGTVALLVATALWLDPVRTTFYLGQINVVLLALVLLDLTGRPSRWRGAGVGLAAALKLTPLLFVVYLLLVGRRREAAVAVGTFVAATGLGFALAPVESVQYWVRGTFAAANRISDVAATSNHSLDGLVARVLGENVPVYLVLAALLTAAALTVAVRAHRRGDDLLALVMVGLASAAVAPFAWSHHFVWCVPLLVLLTVRHARIGLAALLLVTAAVVTRLPGPEVGPIPATGAISLQPDVYLAGFVLVLAAAVLQPRPNRIMVP
ncbi:glycosyltransferase 87 family protein [Pseudonocardia halophobica]|uniref:Conserved hypothtical membrane protein n=1 Tax=Pseudonocardia halophobica TaxID=29401 RepID=A0A9W6NXE4_9PSEU|nr:glycosyltransferase 87 family protein [Pseudonocardia halophobica]GLL12402.1 conserved hypothtical membrane protein [Pseudonocardia halophobica]